MERRPVKGGVDQLGGDPHRPISNSLNLQLGTALANYRALRLMSQFSIRPELAAMLAAAFGGGK